MSDGEETMDESEVDETALEFPDGRFVTPPYPLRRFFGLYWGDALRFDRHWFEASVGVHLCVPPNVAAVVLLANSEHQVLMPGRYDPSRALVDSRRRRVDPVSVQFVTLKVRSHEFSYPFTAINVKYREKEDNLKEKPLTIHVQLALQVTDPVKVTELEAPLEDVKGALKQELIKAFVDYPYDRLYQNRDALNAEIKKNLNAIFSGKHGLTVVDILLIQMDPADASWIDLSQRGSLVDRNSEIRRREAQMEEDIFALEQPYVMRMAQTTINRLNAERDFEARKLTIGSLQELAKAISDDLHNHPGRWSPEESEALNQALTLLERLGGPTRPIAFAPLRSWYSKEHYPPPTVPPLQAPPPTASPVAIDPRYMPSTVPTQETMDRVGKLMTPPPPPPTVLEQKISELEGAVEIMKNSDGRADAWNEAVAKLKEIVKSI